MAGVAGDPAYLAGGHGGLQVVQAGPPQPRPAIEGPGLARLRVPPGLAPGFYHLMALQPEGRADVLQDALEARGDPRPQYRPRPGQAGDAACPQAMRGRVGPR